MKRTICLFIIFALLLGLNLLSCSNRFNPEESDNLSDNSSRSKQGEYSATNPIEGRQNPLQIYIRDYWTNGDQTSVAGMHYDHIKVFGGMFYSLQAGDEDQAQFIADHFDMYMWGGTLVGTYADPGNTTFLWLNAAPGIPFISSNWDSIVTADWIDSPDNEGGYTWDDLVTHMKFDYQTVYGWFPGWNPDDDENDDGCIDNPGQPSDPNRTAECIWNAELKRPMPGSNRAWNWVILKDLSPGFYGVVDMRSDRTRDAFNALPFKGALVDEAAFEAYPWDYGLQNTFSYGGDVPSSDVEEVNFNYYRDKLHYIPHFTYELEQKISEATVIVANTVMPLYTCRTEAVNCAKEWMQSYVENLWDECWLLTGTASTLKLTKERRADWLDCPFLDYMEDGKGYILTALDYPPDPGGRGKRFSLATFYMINHQMAFYYYRTHGHRPEGGDKVWEWQWNPYVEFDVGQPIMNSLGLPDFQGNPFSDRFFVWEDDTDYEILGREYLRDDLKRVLVLTKIMASGQSEGGSETTHCLPGFYRKVLPDLSLSNPIDEISLVNNDGVILVAEPTYSIPFTNVQLSANYLDCTLTISWDTPGVDCRGKAILYSGMGCSSALSTKYESQYGEQHSLTFGVTGGQYYSVKIYAETPCSGWIAEGNCRSHKMNRCIAPPFPKL